MNDIHHTGVSSTIILFTNQIIKVSRSTSNQNGDVDNAISILHFTNFDNQIPQITTS